MRALQILEQSQKFMNVFRITGGLVFAWGIVKMIALKQLLSSLGLPITGAVLSCCFILLFGVGLMKRYRIAAIAYVIAAFAISAYLLKAVLSDGGWSPGVIVVVGLAVALVTSAVIMIQQWSTLRH